MLSKREVLKQHLGIKSIDELFEYLSMDNDLTYQSSEEYVKMQLPYQAQVLPAPIPTIADIRRAREDGDLSRKTGLYNVYKVTKEYVVKFSCDPIILQEAENLLFLQQHSRVRTPTVYAVFSHTGDNPLSLNGDQSVEYHYMVMEFIKGDSLREQDLSLLNKERIYSKISEQIQLLRSVPSEGYYGRIKYQGWHHNYSLFNVRKGDIRGPYNTYQDCISAMYLAAEISAAISTLEEDFGFEELLYLANFKHSLTECGGHEPTLTHLDLKLDNIMIQPTKGHDGTVEDYEVIILDWATLGWLPAWMETVTLLCRPGFRKLADHHAFVWTVSQGIGPLHLAVARFLNSCDKILAYGIP